MTVGLVDVSLRDCPSCRRLVCDDWSTCPGYLRELVDRLEAQDAASREPVGRLVRDERAVA